MKSGLCGTQLCIRSDTTSYVRDENRWGDTSCSNPLIACMCTQDPQIYLELKGYLPNTMIDRYYMLTSDYQDRRNTRFQGLTQTSITYDNKAKLWIANMADSNITITNSASHASFILGKHKWTIKGHKQGDNFVTELKMSGCQKGEFTCNSGQCITMEERCNQKFDCRDESDETN